jgi:hypothetical protein
MNPQDDEQSEDGERQGERDYRVRSLFTACVLPTERALSDLNCAKQAVTIADFECYCSASFGNVPSF